MQTAYTFLWLNDAGDVAAVDGASFVDDTEALQAASALLREDDACRRWRNCGRIETYAGVRFVHEVRRAAA